MHLFEHCVYVTVFDSGCVRVCFMWVHRTSISSKSDKSPAAWQIGTPDLCLCPSLICPPALHHNPSPAYLR